MIVEMFCTQQRRLHPTSIHNITTIWHPHAGATWSTLWHCTICDRTHHAQIAERTVLELITAGAAFGVSDETTLAA